LLDGAPTLTCANPSPINGYVTYTLNGPVVDCDICQDDSCFEGWNLEWTYPDGTKVYEYIDQDSLYAATSSCDLYSFKTLVDNVDPCNLGTMTVKVTNEIDKECTESCREQTYTVSVSECSDEICLGGLSAPPPGVPQAIYDPTTGVYSYAGEGSTITVTDQNGTVLSESVINGNGVKASIQNPVPIVFIFVDGQAVKVQYSKNR
jgi:hypothetical protein